MLPKALVHWKVTLIRCQDVLYFHDLPILIHVVIGPDKRSSWLMASPYQQSKCSSFIASMAHVCALTQYVGTLA